MVVTEKQPNLVNILYIEKIEGVLKERIAMINFPIFRLFLLNKIEFSESFQY